MKKLFSVLLFTVFSVSVFAQQTAKEIVQYQEKYKAIIEKYDDGADSVYRYLLNQIDATQDDIPANAVWHSYLATCLVDKYQSDSYSIKSRTPVQNVLPENLSLWDGQTFRQQIVLHFQQSLLSVNRLMEIPLSDYEEMLCLSPSILYRPTLFDFLAHQACNYYASTRYSADDFKEESILPEDTFLSDNETFCKMSVESPDTLSQTYLMLKLFQLWTEQHLQDADPSALIDITMFRLNSVLNCFYFDVFPDAYLQTLMALEKRYAGKPGYENICYHIAKYYEDRSEQYDPILYPDYQFDKSTAVQWYEKVISFDPASYEAKRAQSEIKFIKAAGIDLLSIPAQPFEKMSGEMVFAANTAVLLPLQLKNIDDLHVRVISVDESFYVKDNYDMVKDLLKEKVVYETVLQIKAEKDYSFHTGQLMIPKMENGHYYLLLSDAPFTADSDKDHVLARHFQVSNINCTSRMTDNRKEEEFFVFDRTSGTPVAKAVVTVSFSNKSKKAPVKLITDADGHCVYRNEDGFGYASLSVSKGTDKLTRMQTCFYGDNVDDKTDTVVLTQLFTDRKLYRPGQTVYFKGILVKSVRNSQFRETCGVEEKRKVQVKLYDASGQLLEIKEYVSNEWGSFSGQFDLPEGLMNGRFELRSSTKDRGTASFRVEEYKRPAYEVRLNQPEETYRLGQMVTLKGQVKAFAGYGVSNAEIKYKVVRSVFFPWLRFYYMMPDFNGEDKVVANGKVTADADGNFSLSFKAVGEQFNPEIEPLYRYQIVADATDITGETHSGEISIVVSDKNLVLKVAVPDNLSAQTENRFSVMLTNIAGKSQSGKVQYNITELIPPEDYLFPFPECELQLYSSELLNKTFPYLALNQQDKMTNWTEGQLMEQGEFYVSPDNPFFSFSEFNQLESGYYRLICSTTDKEGREVKYEKTFLFHKPNDRKTPAYEPLWMERDKKTLKKGDKLEFLIGTYLKNAEVLCEIKAGDKLLSSQWIKLNQNTHKISYLVEDSTIHEIRVHAMVNSHNHLYDREMCFSVIEKDKKLNFEFITFRDKTVPGAKEEVRLKIRGAKGDKVTGEMLCSMYDASLDALSTPLQYNPVLYSYYKDYTSLALKNLNYLYWCRTSFNTYGFQAELKRYPSFKVFLPWSYRRYRGGGENHEYALAAVKETDSDMRLDFDSPVRFDLDRTKSVSLDFDMDDALNESVAYLEEENAEKSEEQNVVIRTNFNETAFFYPHLQTDEDGDIVFSFTMPDALTRWKMLGFAHNAELMSGSFEKYIQSSKNLMVVPNEPRFLREGDTLFFTAKVVNVTDDKMSGKVKLCFRNALDNKKLNLLLSADNQDFNVEGHQSVEVAFRMAVPVGLGAVTYHIEAVTGQETVFGDAEEKTLPVLSNQLPVTETIPLWISGKGKKTFVFDRLKKSFTSPSSSLRQHSLTLDFTPNPVWYALLSMPYLMEYPYECNEQMFSRFYANSLAAHVVQSNPRIQKVFEQWLNESPDVFCSQLEKNQELKQLLLEETPWVTDARKEGADRQKIAVLFDMKRMSKEQETALNKLQKRQNSDGGWSWFAGGRSSAYITEHIVAGLGHLDALGVHTAYDEKMCNDAIRFMDQEMLDAYQQYAEKAEVEAANLHYLYARSFFPDQKLGKYETAYRFYLANAKKQWQKQSVYVQAMTALVLYRSGDVATAKTIMAAIKDRAQYNEEMGMWWKKEGSGYFWYEAPIERQAMLIEAFNTITKDEISVERMQQWLLKQKQTQNWGTTRATTEACYALLMNNQQFDNENGVKISMGTAVVDTESEGEKGSGYVKKSWNDENITEDKATISIEKNNAGPAWGGVYWQYFENMDKVSRSDDHNLTIESCLYLVQQNDRGEMLIPLSQNVRLHVGDKVRVRTVIHAYCDMEYVHLKSMRAAGFEPVNALSGYRYQDGLYYYECVKDASANFFIDCLPLGIHVFEYTLVAAQTGSFSNGISSVQCMYAPEFSAHSAGERVVIEQK